MVDFLAAVRMTLVPRTPRTSFVVFVLMVFIFVLMVVVNVPIIYFIFRRCVVIAFRFVECWHIILSKFCEVFWKRLLRLPELCMDFNHRTRQSQRFEVELTPLFALAICNSPLRTVLASHANFSQPQTHFSKSRGGCQQICKIKFTPRPAGSFDPCLVVC
jgi:hypothetical protein